MKNKKKKTNIWIFNHYAITPQYPGGTRHFELGKNLVRRGHHVVIFAANFIHMNFCFVKLARQLRYKIERFGHLHFTWLKTPAYRKNNWKRFLNMLGYCWSAFRVSRRLVNAKEIEPPGIIIGSTVHPFAALTASSLASKFNVPFVFEIRDLWPQSFLDMGIWKKFSWKTWLFKAIEKRTVANAKKIITLSPRTASYLQENYHYAPDDIYYIPNGVYIDSLKKALPADETLKFLENIKKERNFIVLFSGSLISTNKLETIIDAAVQLRDNQRIKVVLIGKGQEEERYRELIKNKNLGNIFISAPVQKEYVPYLLQYADALILNQGNVQWGSSNKLYDYLASGKPIISSVHAKHNDIVSDIGGGMSVTPENPQELVRAILQLQKMSPQEREQMGQRNVNYVKTYHDWEVLSERLADLVNQLQDIE